MTVTIAAGSLSACEADKPVAAPANSCPTPVPSPSATIAPSTIYLNILNAGGSLRLAGKTKIQLGWRGFHILDAGNQSLLDDGAVPTYSEIRYGKGARQIALTLATQVKNPVLTEIERANPVIDLVLGDKFALVPVPPPPAAQVQVNVYNTTFRSGLSGSVAADLRTRAFQVLTNGNDPARSYFPNDTAVIRHGERGEPFARRAQLQIKGARLVQDAREDETVDVVLGSKFEDLQPLAQATPAPSPQQTRPPGC